MQCLVARITMSLRRRFRATETSHNISWRLNFTLYGSTFHNIFSAPNRRAKLSPWRSFTHSHWDWIFGPSYHKSSLTTIWLSTHTAICNLHRWILATEVNWLGWSPMSGERMSGKFTDCKGQTSKTCGLDWCTVGYGVTESSHQINTMTTL